MLHCFLSRFRLLPPDLNNVFIKLAYVFMFHFNLKRVLAISALIFQPGSFVNDPQCLRHMALNPLHLLIVHPRYSLQPTILCLSIQKIVQQGLKLGIIVKDDIVAVAEDFKPCKKDHNSETATKKSIANAFQVGILLNGCCEYHEKHYDHRNERHK